MSAIPPRPDGYDNQTTWAKWVHDTLTSLKFLNSPTVTVSRSPEGILFTSAAGGGSGATAKIYAITQLYGVPSAIRLPGIDYIGVTPWDPAANDGDGGTTGSQILIAKSIDGRQPGFETIDGEVIQYTYTDDNHRVATPASTSVENQVMHKRYMVWPNASPDDSMVDNNQILVYVQKIIGGTGVLDMNQNQIQYAEVNPNREWALAAS